MTVNPGVQTSFKSCSDSTTVDDSASIDLYYINNDPEAQGRPKTLSQAQAGRERLRPLNRNRTRVLSIGICLRRPGIGIPASRRDSSNGPPLLIIESLSLLCTLYTRSLSRSGPRCAKRRSAPPSPPLTSPRVPCHPAPHPSHARHSEQLAWK